MYTPGSFRVDDLAILHALIRDHNFGVVYSQVDGAPMATHLPWMIDSQRGPYGTLIAHMARANPHWKTWTDQTELLVVFQGPHTYISPAWYEDDVTVPTWNYAAVHAYGRPRFVTAPEQLRVMVEALIEFQEEPLGRPWDQTKKESVMETELKGIVGFEIVVERLEGKWKFNQNRSESDQQAVISVLNQAQGDNARAVAKIMERNLSRPKNRQ